MMKRLILTVALLGLFAAGIVGCRAGVDVEPTHKSSSTMPPAR